MTLSLRDRDSISFQRSQHSGTLAVHCHAGKAPVLQPSHFSKRSWKSSCCVKFLFFFFFILENHSLKKLFCRSYKTDILHADVACGQPAWDRSLNPMPSSQTWRLNRQLESAPLPVVTEQVYAGAKAQTNFLNSHPPTFLTHNRKQVCIDHRSQGKTGQEQTPMKEHSTAGNEEITSQRQ